MSSTFDIDSFMGFESYMKCYAQLDQFNAYKTLVHVLNRAIAEMSSDGEHEKFFFNIHTIEFDTSSIESPKVQSSTVASLKPQAEVVVKKVDSDFL